MHQFRQTLNSGRGCMLELSDQRTNMAICGEKQTKNQLLARCVEKRSSLGDTSRIKSARGRWSHLSRTLDVQNLIQQVMEMNSQYNYVVSVISKPPDERQQSECEELIGWFKSRVRKIFNNLQMETITDVIRNCKFERKKPNELIIKQGEIGEQMFIVLKGSLSVYVQDLIDDVDQLQVINSTCPKELLEDRSILGEYRANTGLSAVVGEIALIKKDCVRTASVVVDEETDLVVIDRELYNRSVRETLERDYVEKRNFVIDNLLFKDLAPKTKRQLIICLRKETFQYGNVIIRQGTNLDKTYFVLQGEIEVSINAVTTRIQYKSAYDEVKSLLPQLMTGKTERMKESEILYESRSNRRQLCLLGANEHIGLIEQSLGLPTYMETVTTMRTSHLMVLEKRYEDLLMKKSGNSMQSNTHFLEVSHFRLSLYAHRCQLPETSAIFRYFMLKLQDESLLTELRKQRAVKTAQNKKTTPHHLSSSHQLKEADDRVGISNIRLSRLKKPLPVTFERQLERQNTEKIVLCHIHEMFKKWKVLNKVDDLN